MPKDIERLVKLETSPVVVDHFMSDRRQAVPIDNDVLITPDWAKESPIPNTPQTIITPLPTMNIVG